MSANTHSIEYWNRDAGPAWVRGQEIMDRFLEPFGARVLAALDLRGGERVLDVGCGCGASTLALARAVGEGGRVVGVDVSRPMLARAAERAREAALAARIEWREADAQTAELGRGVFDRVHSRFGVMFFEAPEQAFSSLARATRPGGQLGFVCWQSRTLNAWLAEPARAAAPYLELPPAAEDDAPGPFGLASGERLQRILREAGWSGVELEPLLDPVHAGESVEEAVALLSTVGPVGAGLRRPGVDDAARARARRGARGARRVRRSAGRAGSRGRLAGHGLALSAGAGPIA